MTKEEYLKASMKWYAVERNAEIDEFDEYDMHVCRVAASYAEYLDKQKQS